jgi:hypothetical protein
MLNKTIFTDILLYGGKNDIPGAGDSCDLIYYINGRIYY